MKDPYRVLGVSPSDSDETIKKAELIISELEKAEALSMDEYQRRASEASALLQQCKEELS